MPVQVPKLERLNPQGPASEGRVQTNLPNVEPALEKTNKAMMGAAQAGFDLLERYENDAADTEANKRVHAYHDWFNKNYHGDPDKGVVGIKHKTDDPTSLYYEFDTEMQKKFNELTAADDNMSSRTRKVLMKKMAEKHNQLNDEKLTGYGHQFATYTKNVDESLIGLEQKGLINASKYIKAGDDTSFKFFDAQIAKIRDVRIRSGMKMGGAHEDPEGKSLFVDEEGVIKRVNVGPVTDLQLKKDLSEGIYNSIDNMLNAKMIPEADAMIKKYRGYLDPAKEAKITEEYTKRRIQVDAIKAVEAIDGKPVEQQKKLLDKIKDPDVKQEAYKQLDARVTHRADITKKASDEAYNKLASEVIKRQRSGDPYQTVADLEDDPLFIRLGKRVTDANQLKAVYELVEQNKESDADAKAALLESLRDGQMIGMEPTKLAEMQVGLNKEDRTFFDRQWVKENTETDAQERSRARFAAETIYKRAEGLGLVKRNTKTGRFSKKDITYLSDLQTRILTDFDKYPKGASVQEFTTHINDVLSEESVKRAKAKRGLLDSLFRRPMPEKKEVEPFSNEPISTRVKIPQVSVSATPSPSPTPSPGATPLPKEAGLKKITPAERLAAVEAFKKANNNKLPGSPAELMDFIKKQKEKQ